MSMKSILINIFACCTALCILAGCERDDVTGRPDSGHPLVFTAAIGSSENLSVGTRATRADLTEIEALLKEARGRLEKKTFNYTTRPHDIIRVCNVSSTSDVPDFTLSSGKRTYEYVCKKYSGTFTGNEGSQEEDEHLSKNPTTYSEYEFGPNSNPDGTSLGFYLNNLVDNNNNAFDFYAMWRQNYEAVAETSIPTDQSTEEGFKNADIMLAFLGHSLEKLEEPFRLIFYHSLSMLDVRVTLPVYTGPEGGVEAPPSGYKEGEVKMSMTNVPTRFTIATTETYSSGDAVNVVVPDSPERATIPMYKYYVEDGGGHEELDNDQDNTKSMYKTYGFCGIMVPTTWLSSGEILPLLRLELTDPLTGRPERYTYTPSPNEADKGTELSLQGGCISILNFRLSRSLKKMMLVRAKIEDWIPATTQLDLQKVETGEN